MKLTHRMRQGVSYYWAVSNAPRTTDKVMGSIAGVVCMVSSSVLWLWTQIRVKARTNLVTQCRVFCHSVQTYVRLHKTNRCCCAMMKAGAFAKHFFGDEKYPNSSFRRRPESIEFWQVNWKSISYILINGFRPAPEWRTGKIFEGLNDILQRSQAAWNGFRQPYILSKLLLK